MLQKDIWICLIVISYPILVITLAYFANVAKNELEQVKKLKDKINRLEISKNTDVKIDNDVFDIEFELIKDGE